LLLRGGKTQRARFSGGKPSVSSDQCVPATACSTHQKRGLPSHCTAQCNFIVEV
jgi:hypothetical protein